MRYKVLAELNNRGAETFANFYTNRSGNARSSNTLFSAQADSKTASVDKVAANSSSDQESVFDLTSVSENTAFHKDYKAEKAQTEDRLLKGNLRETLGKGYTGFVRNLWENKDNPLYKEMHAYVNKEMQKNGFDVNKGVESFLVSKIGNMNDPLFKAETVAMRDKIAKSLPPVEVVDGAYVDTDTRFRKTSPDSCSRGCP